MVHADVFRLVWSGDANQRANTIVDQRRLANGCERQNAPRAIYTCFFSPRHICRNIRRRMRCAYCLLCGAFSNTPLKSSNNL